MISFNILRFMSTWVYWIFIGTGAIVNLLYTRLLFCIKLMIASLLSYRWFIYLSWWWVVKALFFLKFIQNYIDGELLSFLNCDFQKIPIGHFSREQISQLRDRLKKIFSLSCYFEYTLKGGFVFDLVKRAEI